MQEKRCFQAFFTLLTLILLLTSSVLVAWMQAPDASGSMDSAALPSADTLSDEAPYVATAQKTGVQNFLLCGKDRASGLYDVIILAQLDANTNTASLVQIPRDTYAAYTENDYKKLNGAASALGGIDKMAEFLAANLGIPIHHYAQIDLDTVGEIVDAIGGVTMTIPADMDYEDSAQGLSIHLKAGEQTLNGDMAEQFLRFRSGYVTADLGRLDAQKAFVSAFLSEVKHASLPKLLRIVGKLYGRVKTDLSLKETARLVVTALKLSPDTIRMMTLPGEAVRTGVDSGAWYYVIQRDAAYRMISDTLRITEESIPTRTFDPLERFTNADYPHFEAIYRKQ